MIHEAAAGGAAAVVSNISTVARRLTTHLSSTKTRLGFRNCCANPRRCCATVCGVARRTRKLSIYIAKSTSCAVASLYIAQLFRNSTPQLLTATIEGNCLWGTLTGFYGPHEVWRAACRRTWRRRGRNSGRIPMRCAPEVVAKLVAIGCNSRATLAQLRRIPRATKQLRNSCATVARRKRVA